MVKFAVILYVNRSGSTLLSRLLSEASEDIFVFPELAFPLWLLIERAAGRRAAGERLYRLIGGDPRLPALALPPERIRAICGVNSSDDPAALLLDMATDRMGRPPRAIVFKLERLIAFPDLLKTLFGEILFIHLVRDPRAVVSSMMRSPVPEKPGFTMARGSAVFAARHWRDYMRRMDAIASVHSVLRIRYEDLCNAPEAVVADVADRLDLASSPRSRSRPDRYAISELDRALHAKLFDPPAPARVAAWHAELPRPAVRVVERICGEAMARLGYLPSEPRLNGASPAFGLAMLRHGRASVTHVARSLWSYARRPDPLRALRRRLREAIATWRR